MAAGFPYLIMAFEMSYNCNHGYKTALMGPLSLLVSQASGRPIPAGINAASGKDQAKSML
jgi:hypothetical protein